VGGAIGAIAGQQIDSALFAPKARQGPRLGELAVQTSSYGSPIPKIFGTMRVAGTVIWSTDLIEDRTRSGGGKGQPKTVTYSYSASFAVALSGRPIRGVGRIWADGKLLRGAAGDFKSGTGFRLYLGSEDQAVDPRIASVEGAGKAPAHRGIAYAMFEDFQLADYGNRIPSLTFEAIADAGAVAIGAIAEELSDETLSEAELRNLEAMPRAATACAARSRRWRCGAAVAWPREREVAAEGGWGNCHAGEAGMKRGLRGLPVPAGGARFRGARQRTFPAEVSIAYHDIERDYQTGLQRAARGGPAIKSDRRALPARTSCRRGEGLCRASAEQALGSAGDGQGSPLLARGESGRRSCAAGR
jgi:hypothetical protein